ncbi:ATP-binding cassette domain-containing protein [Sphingomonas sp.]|uniref:ATP-binding cassette domain-containing protein n=1 Tax=Sphingomonas sp. TaxID=28214 RepID=UPI002CC58E6C|nr:ATP-binding cassette domain-containing protein [Sphingomonas sp.]HWK35354.1 ATP-binding cassette domain-containing protein [Sphingomonas sp.]
MSFEVDVARRIGDRDVACAITGDAPLTILFGRSGAGKTSVLNMIAGLLRPDRGTIRVGGVTLFDAASGLDLPPDRRRAGYVFQDGRLFPHLRVAANLRYGRHGTNTSSAAFDDVVALLDIGDLLDRWPRTLSGGEARRVAIGRALLSDPAFLLLDEPLSSLDRARREEVMRALERLRDQARLPILMVTHDRVEADRLGGRIVEIP